MKQQNKGQKKSKGKICPCQYMQAWQRIYGKISLLAEERPSLSKVKNLLFGGNGDSWITSGIKDYFPSATYFLCFYHLFKKIRECLERRKPEQKFIKDLLLSKQIDEGWSVINQLIRNPHDLKEKEQLKNPYTYISHNRQGIANQVKLKDKRAGAIELNVNQAIATRFKKIIILLAHLQSFYVIVCI